MKVEVDLEEWNELHRIQGYMVATLVAIENTKYLRDAKDLAQLTLKVLAKFSEKEA